MTEAANGQIPDWVTYRLAQIHFALTLSKGCASFRKDGHPFIPVSKGYNRDDGNTALAKVPELLQISDLMMRHRPSEGGRLRFEPNGGLRCMGCSEVFAAFDRLGAHQSIALCRKMR